MVELNLATNQLTKVPEDIQYLENLEVSVCVSVITLLIMYYDSYKKCLALLFKYLFLFN